MSFPVTSVTKRRLEAFIVGFIFLSTVLVISLFYLHWDFIQIKQRREEISQIKIWLFCIINHLVNSATYKNLNFIIIAILVFLPILIGEILLSLSKALLEINFNKPLTENILRNLENNASPKRIKLISLAPKSKLFISLQDLNQLEESYLLQEAVTLRKDSELIFSIISSFFLTFPFILITISLYLQNYDPPFILICLPFFLFFAPIILYAFKLSFSLLHSLSFKTFFSCSLTCSSSCKTKKRFTNYFLTVNIALQFLALLFLFINLLGLLLNLTNKVLAIIISFAITFLIGILYTKVIDNYTMSNIYIYLLSKARREQRAEED